MYRITQCLSVGRFPAPERAGELRDHGVTHVLNVCDAPSQLSCGDGFAAVEWCPLSDFSRLTGPVVLPILDALHRLACEPAAHVYIHCVAGQLRSPTVLWLYLIACGYNPESARNVIESRSPDAAPGTRRLAGPGLAHQVQMHGLAHYFPHPRGEVLVPYPIRPTP